LLGFILIILYAAYVVVLIVLPALTDLLPESLEGSFPSLYRFIVAAILFFVVGGAVLYILRGGSGSTPENKNPPGTPPDIRRAPPGPPPRPVTSDGAPRFKPVEKKEEQKKEEPGKEKEIVVYPREVEGGIYGDTYIGIDENRMLKLRSMVVEPEYVK